MKRRTFIALGSAFAAAPSPARAQQRRPVIGLLFSLEGANTTEHLGAIRQGLREAGFVEGQNVDFLQRSAENVYGRLPALAAELVASKVDVIIAQAPPAARAAKAATTTIPIVFGVGIDPVADGLVASLARPGGNLTGATLLTSERVPKQFGLLAELVPQARRFALLLNQKVPNPWLGDVVELARARGVRLQTFEAATAEEIDAAFAKMAQERVEALLIGEDTFLATRPQVAELALRHGIPSLGQLRGYAVAGGLASYGTNLTDVYRLIGATAGRILKGAKPADLPVQRPVRFDLILNLKTAAALGVTVPPLLLAQADEVIE